MNKIYQKTLSGTKISANPQSDAPIQAVIAGMDRQSRNKKDLNKQTGSRVRARDDGRWRKGFTLIELLVVVLIIGILAAIALPQYRLAAEKARAIEAVGNVVVLAEAAERYYLANGKYPFEDGEGGLEALDVKIPADKFLPYGNAGNYVALSRKGSPHYIISKTLNSAAGRAYKRPGVTCFVGDTADTGSDGGKICKALCGVSTLTKVWGSGQLGCEMKL